MRVVVAAALALVAAPAAAQVEFRPVVESVLVAAILPAHDALAAATADQSAAVASLCAEPSAAALDAARREFRTVVAAYGRVEPFRLGPAVAENRFDRILFWPDRRSRGQQQVQALLADGGEPDPAALAKKSVAVQGLPALELVLWGDGADALAGADGTARCRYGLAVAQNLKAIAGELAAAWRGTAGEALRGAGDGPASPYVSHGEVVKDLLGTAAELLSTDLLKLGAPVIGDLPGEGNPRLAPLWRSGSTLALILGNARGVAALATPELERALGTDGGNAVQEIRFEAAQLERALSPVAATPLPEVASAAEGHRRLRYAAGPLAALQRLLAQRIPQAFGFAAGFNALDGD